MSILQNGGFPGGADGKESSCSAGDLGVIPGSQISPGEGNDCPLRYSCQEKAVVGGPGGLQCMGLRTVKHNWANNTCILPNRPFSAVQLLSRVRLFESPWTAARQASLSITNSRSLLKLLSVESVMPSTISSPVVLFSSCFQSFPASGSFPMSQFFASGGQSIGVSASTSVLLMNIQDWSLLGWTGSISLQSKGLSRVFSNTTVQKRQFFGPQLSL